MFRVLSHNGKPAPTRNTGNRCRADEGQKGARERSASNTSRLQAIEVTTAQRIAAGAHAAQPGVGGTCGRRDATAEKTSCSGRRLSEHDVFRCLNGFVLKRCGVRLVYPILQLPVINIRRQSHRYNLPPHIPAQ